MSTMPSDVKFDRAGTGNNSSCFVLPLGLLGLPVLLAVCMAVPTPIITGITIHPVMKYTIAAVTLVVAALFLVAERNDDARETEKSEQDDRTGTGRSQQQEDDDATLRNVAQYKEREDDDGQEKSNVSIDTSLSHEVVNGDGNDEEESIDDSNSNTWRCSCESGFLPPGLLKTFGGAEAMMRLGTGQCYHKG